jgi:F-type H+-transporting ATPase subunit gamma
MEQRAVVKRLLPFEPSEIEAGKKRKRQIEYEPGAEEVFNYLVSKYAEIVMYQAIVESATCEHASRRLAMQNATDNANDMIGNLELSFNRARQAAITNEITEIVSGADAIK